MKQKISKAEQNFFAAFMGEEKVAVELEPETAEALGIPTVSPSTLDALEGSASQSPNPAAPDETEAEEASAPTLRNAEESPPQEVAAFDAVDEEPAADEEDESAVPELPSRATHGRVFTGKRAHPLDILGVLEARYKDEWDEWEPATLWWALRRDFGQVGQVTRDKIGALRVALTTDLPWQDWDTYENCSLAWSDLVPLVGVFQPLTPSQAAFGVQTLRAIRPDEAFNNEVNAYIAAILDDDGWVFAPQEYFAGAQELLDRKVWLTGLRHEVEQAWARVQNADPSSIEWDHGKPLHIHLIKLFAVKYYVSEREALRGQTALGRTSASVAQPPVPQ